MLRLPRGIKTERELCRLQMACVMYDRRLPAVLRATLICHFVFGEEGRVTPANVGAFLGCDQVGAAGDEERKSQYACAENEVVRLGGKGIVAVVPLLPAGGPLSCAFCHANVSETVKLWKRASGIAKSLGQARVMLTRNGITKGLLFMRECHSCGAKHNGTYAEIDGVVAVHPTFHTQTYFVASTRTVYSIDLLKEYQRQLMMQVGSFHGFEDMYKEEFLHGYVSMCLLGETCLDPVGLPCWVVSDRYLSRYLI